MSAVYSSHSQTSLVQDAVSKASHFSRDLHSPKHNYLLKALPINEYVRLLHQLEQVKMNAGDVLHESGAEIEWVYFPTTCIVCMEYITESGFSPSVSITGNDGLVGIACVMGSNSSSTRAVVQSDGIGYRIRASAFKKELQKNEELQRIALLYSMAFITQISQTAVCNRLHSVDQKLCRWLLMCMDRLEAYQIPLTQGLIASMLGVRREGITQAARKLQDKGYIRYSRGKILVLDRRALEEAACECYSVVNDEYKRLLNRDIALQIPQKVPKIAASHMRLTRINGKSA